MLRDCCLWLLVVTWVPLLLTTGEPDLFFLTTFLLTPFVGSKIEVGSQILPSSGRNMALRVCKGQILNFL